MAHTPKNNNDSSGPQEGRKFSPDDDPVWHEVRATREEVREMKAEIRALRNERDPARNIDFQEAASIAGVSERTLRSYAADGSLPTLKIGRRRLIPYRGFTAWLRRRVDG